MPNKRWYDIDSIVSVAIEIFQSANDDKKLEIANFITEKAKFHGITTKNNALDDKFNYVLKRWYDKDKVISEAFEYLKECPSEIRHEIGLEIIERYNNSH